MPLPKPKEDESKKDFLKRCMGNNTMNDEYPERDQRFAVCNTQWRNRNKEISMDKITKYFTEKAEKIDKRILRFVGSDQKTDRDGDKIMIDGWNLTEYRKNPVVLFGHRQTETPVAKTKKVWVNKETNQLMFDIEFPESDVSSVGDSLYKLYKNGFMSATSVSFIPDLSKIEYPEKKKDKDPYRVFGGQSLMEISLVSVPANPRALLTSKSMSNAINENVIDDIELQELLNYFEMDETDELKKIISDLQSKIVGLELQIDDKELEDNVYEKLYSEYVSAENSELSIDSVLEDLKDDN